MCFDRENNRQITEYPLYLHEDEKGNSEIIGRKGRKVRRLEMGGGMPEGGEPYKQLVTDGEGVAKWEDRLAYSYIGEDVIFSETEVTITDGVADVQSYWAQLWGNEYSYAVVFDGVRYVCTPENLQYHEGYIGNPAIADGGEDNGQPFAIRVKDYCTMASILARNDGLHTVAVYGLYDAIHAVPTDYLGIPIQRGASGWNSMVFNACSENVATGDNSAAMGYNSRATGAGAFAFGYENQANGDCSIAAGSRCLAETHCQIVLGHQNIQDTAGKYLFIVGNGSLGNSKRSNAHTLDWSGNAWFAGTMEGTGVIIKSPNGTRYQIAVADDGTLSATAVE